MEGINFKQVYDMKNLEFCKWAKIATGPSFGFMKNFVNYINQTFKGVVRACPLQGNFQMVNASFNLENKAANNFLDRVQVFPNGFYKLTIKIHKSDDEMIGMIKMNYVVYIRSHHLSGFENF